jgi:hypothetical protein
MHARQGFIIKAFLKTVAKSFVSREHLYYINNEIQSKTAE